MSESKEARHFVLDTFVVAVTLGVAKLRALITLPLVVKLLGTEEYGIWSQTLTLSTVVANVFLLNIHLPLVRFVSADKNMAGPVYASILCANIAIFAILAAPVLVLIEPIAGVAMGRSGLESFVLIALGLILVNNVRLINLNFYRGTDRIKTRSYIDMTSTVLSMALICVMLLEHSSLFSVLLALTLWEGAIAILTTAHCFRIAGLTRPSRAIIGKAFRYCLPLLPSGLAVPLLDRADRFFIGNHLGLRQVGIYSAGYALSAGLLMFQTPLQFTLLPKVSALWERDKAKAGRYLSMAIHSFLALGIPCVCALPILGPSLLRVLGNAETGSASPAVIFMIALGVLLWGVSLCLSNVYYAGNRTGALTRVLVLTASLNIVLNAVLVPVMRLPGAALATTVSYALTAALLYIQGRSDLRLTWYRAFLLKCVFSSFVVMAVLAAWAPRHAQGIAAALAAGSLIYLVSLIATRALGRQHWRAAKEMVKG